MSAQSPELQLQIQTWRAKSREGTLTKEEMREALAALRNSRGAVKQATAGSRATKTAAGKAGKPDSDKLLGELDGL